MNTDLTVEVSRGVAVLTLNRPERLNAYTAEMGRLLGEAYQACDDDDEVRAIVLTGAGSAFCVGADFSADDEPFASPHDDDGLHRLADSAGGVRDPQAGRSRP